MGRRRTAFWRLQGEISSDFDFFAPGPLKEDSQVMQIFNCFNFLKLSNIGIKKLNFVFLLDRHVRSHALPGMQSPSIIKIPLLSN